MALSTFVICVRVCVNDICFARKSHVNKANQWHPRNQYCMTKEKLLFISIVVVAADAVLSVAFFFITGFWLSPLKPI